MIFTEIAVINGRDNVFGISCTKPHFKDSELNHYDDLQLGVSFILLGGFVNEYIYFIKERFLPNIYLRIYIFG